MKTRHAFLALPTVVATPAQAAILLDQEQTTVNAIGGFLDGVSSLSQTFTVGVIYFDFSGDHIRVRRGEYIMTDPPDALLAGPFLFYRQLMGFPCPWVVLQSCAGQKPALTADTYNAVGT